MAITTKQQLYDATRCYCEDIFSAILIGGMELNEENKDKARLFLRAMPLFKQRFKHNIFMQEFALFYTMIVDSKLEYFREEAIDSVIERNKTKILNSPYIDINAFINGMDNGVDVQTEETKLNTFKVMVKEEFRYLNNRYILNSVDFTKFESACNLYIDAYVDFMQKDIPNKMTIIMGDSGLSVKMPNCKNKVYRGYEDACRYFRENNKIIEDFKFENGNHSSTVVDRDWLEERIEERTRPDIEGTIGTGLKEIDDVIGVIRRSNMIGVLGPPKGGKTRFSTYLASKFLDAGYNVAVWPLEGTREEWDARIISNIIFKNYKVVISDGDILKRNLTPDQLQIVQEAEVELAIGKGRGTLSYINMTAYVEDFLEVLKSHYESDNAFDVIVIDSPVNILSRYGRDKAGRISDAYEALKNFVCRGVDKKIVAILPAQLKQSVIDWLRTHPTETIDVTAGGESAATIRSPDYVWGLFSTKEERNNDMMKIYDVASRHGANFGDFYSACKLGSCAFWSEPELNNVFKG